MLSDGFERRRIGLRLMGFGPEFPPRLSRLGTDDVEALALDNGEAKILASRRRPNHT